jgi:hypothetical protein
MYRRDRRGRIRQPDQERGLRPLYPTLDEGWESRALRVAMPLGLWRLFDRLVEFFPSSTQARSCGEAIAYLLRREQAERAQWLDWEQEKQRRLIQRAGRQNN